MWQRIAQALHIRNPETDMPVEDMEAEGESTVPFEPPDWALMSPQGLMAVLQLSVSVFSKVHVRFMSRKWLNIHSSFPNLSFYGVMFSGKITFSFLLKYAP